MTTEQTQETATHNYESLATLLADISTSANELALQRDKIEAEYTEPLVADLKTRLLKTINDELYALAQKAEGVSQLLTDRLAVPYVTI